MKFKGKAKEKQDAETARREARREQSLITKKALEQDGAILRRLDELLGVLEQQLQLKQTSAPIVSESTGDILFYAGQIDEDYFDMKKLLLMKRNHQGDNSRNSMVYLEYAAGISPASTTMTSSRSQGTGLISTVNSPHH
ncbi:hypothetical protein BGZ65_002465 [Modicella reniformis]|uniref:Uncharacterized protein n=1 Tax=Modicella reniformis TaxID=1440133 RepID=A0A9P6IL23_9FUNG|nr:hypothetical protein BGZ65_002465 [Modicella reniformis]